MSPDLIPFGPDRGVGGLNGLAASDLRTRRSLSAIERRTLIRLASVQGHALVQNEKLHEIDRLTREAVSGQALLSHWAATLAKGDAFLTDELKFFTDLARIGKGEIVADTVSDFCQEGRR
jgi:hypothetical protein